jgi:hypothetical protein
MSRGANGYTRVAIKKNVPVNVFHPNALSPFRNEFKFWTRIRGSDVTSIGLDDLFPLRTW